MSTQTFRIADTPPVYALCPKCGKEIEVVFGETLHDRTSAIQTCTRCNEVFHLWIRIPRTKSVSEARYEPVRITDGPDSAIRKPDAPTAPTGRPDTSVFNGATGQWESAATPPSDAGATPRLDGLRNKCLSLSDHEAVEEYYDFARTLERELAEAKKCWESDTAVIVSLRRELAERDREIKRLDAFATEETKRCNSFNERLAQSEQAHAATLAKLEEAQTFLEVAKIHADAVETASEQQIQAERTIANENRRINAGLCEQIEELTRERDEQSKLWDQTCDRLYDRCGEIISLNKQVAALAKERDDLKETDEYTAQKLTDHAEAVGVNPDHIDYIEETTKAIVKMWAENSQLKSDLAAQSQATAAARRDGERLQWLMARAKVKGGGDGADYTITFRTPIDTECDIAALDAAMTANTQP